MESNDEKDKIIQELEVKLKSLKEHSDKDKIINELNNKIKAVGAKEEKSGSFFDLDSDDGIKNARKTIRVYLHCFFGFCLAVVFGCFLINLRYRGNAMDTCQRLHSEGFISKNEVDPLYRELINAPFFLRYFLGAIPNNKTYEILKEPFEKNFENSLNEAKTNWITEAKKKGWREGEELEKEWLKAKPEYIKYLKDQKRK